jgi:hypothetical protein
LFSLRYERALAMLDASIEHCLAHEAPLGVEFAQAGRLLLLDKMGRWQKLDEMFGADVQRSSAYLTIWVLQARLMTR